MDFKVTVLGTCSATFAWGRHQSATLVQFDNLHFLIDCGEGTQLQFIDHKIKTAKLEAIFISHLHGDHYLGLVGLLGTMSMGGRKKSLTIYSPIGLKEIIEVQFKHSGTILNYELIIIEHQADRPEVIAQFQYLKVSTLPLQHRVPCTGYLFEETIAKRKFRSDLNLEVVPLPAIKAMKEGEDYSGPEGTYFAADWIEETRPPRKFAYCSDTIYLPHLAAQIKGADLLYHEATFDQEHITRAKETFHSTAIEAATVAKDAGAGRLIISHFSSRFKELDVLVNEAKSVFPNAEAAVEGAEYPILVNRTITNTK